MFQISTNEKTKIILENQKDFEYLVNKVHPGGEVLLIKETTILPSPFTLVVKHYYVNLFSNSSDKVIVFTQSFKFDELNLPEDIKNDLKFKPFTMGESKNDIPNFLGMENINPSFGNDYKNLDHASLMVIRNYYDTKEFRFNFTDYKSINGMVII